jgi:hypothetical protein
MQVMLQGVMSSMGVKGGGLGLAIGGTINGCSFLRLLGRLFYKETLLTGLSDSGIRVSITEFGMS